MKFRYFFYSVLFHLFASATLFAQKDISLVSWNIQHLGDKKKPEVIHFIAKTIQNYDVIAIQEVVAGSNSGVNAVDRLTKELKRLQPGSNWKYVVSGPTKGNPNQSERYAFVWKGKKLKIIGNPWLDRIYEQEIEREPYMAIFTDANDTFTLVNFHAVPKSKQPEKEIKYFKTYPQLYPRLKLIFLGDFNTPQYNNVFNPLKTAGYLPALTNQKTTLKMKCVEDECLASEYDNIFYHKNHFHKTSSGIIHFYKEFEDVKSARQVSDHVPIFMKFRGVKSF